MPDDQEAKDGKGAESDDQHQSKPDVDMLDQEVHTIQHSTGINILQLCAAGEQGRLLEARQANEIRSNDARRSVLIGILRNIQTIEDETERPMIEMRRSLVSAYVEGLCGDAAPPEQDGREVLQAFQQDQRFVQQLAFLLPQERNRAAMDLVIAFLSGQYPVTAGKDEAAAKQALEQELDRLRQTPFANPEQEQAMSATAISQIAPELADQAGSAYLRVLGVVRAMQQFRETVSREQSVESADGPVDLEKMYREEEEYLLSLPLPEYERGNLPELLLNTYRRGFFKPSLRAQPKVREEVQWMITHLPTKEEFYDDPWADISELLHNYWLGQHYPDDLRWSLLQKRAAEMETEMADEEDLEREHPFNAHKKFVSGSFQRSRPHWLEKPAALQAAYEADIELIRSAQLQPEDEKDAIREYEDELIAAEHLKLYPSKEKPERRDALRRKFQQLKVDGVLDRDCQEAVYALVGYWDRLNRGEPEV